MRGYVVVSMFWKIKGISAPVVCTCNTKKSDIGLGDHQVVGVERADDQFGPVVAKRFPTHGGV